MSAPLPLLAHFNWATLRADEGDPLVAEFFDAADRVNALSERSAGFVWRHGDEMAAAKVIGWPLFTVSDRVIASFSVWESAAALEQFVYRTVHGAFFRRGKEWFEPGKGVNYALWTIPRGHIPKMAEARDRVEHMIAHGPTDHAFDFARTRA